MASDNDTTPQAAPSAAPERPAAKKKTVYRRVRFHAKAHANQTINVILQHNSAPPVFIERNVEVVLPDYLVEIATNAKEIRERDDPRSGQRVTEEIRTYPFDDLGAGSEADYQGALAHGRVAMRQWEESLARQA